MDMYQKREMRKNKKMNENTKSLPSTSINWYPGHMAKTKRLVKEQLDLIDIVYELVDSRMPYSSKIKDIDDVIKNKPRILIFTKYDLCDKKETEKWIKYYQNKGYKTITLDNSNNSNLKPLLKLTEEVMEPINKKRLEKGLLKKKTRVLIVGIPNVGKSTLLNRLVGKNAQAVGNKPGITKQLNWIRINSDIELLDTPGILWPKFESESVAFNLASLSAIKEEILPLYDVCEYILNMLYKYYPSILSEKYKIDELDDDIITTFEVIGKKRGCLIKGGLIDYDKVVNIIINDIKSGNIKNITFDRYNYE